MSKNIYFRILIIFFSLLGFKHAVADPDRLLENIEYLNVDQKSAIRVTFSDVISYIKHFPINRGNTLEVHVRVLDLEKSDVLEHADREVLLAPISDTIPLIGVTQEGEDPNNPVIIIRFSAVVDYQVKPDPAGRALLIVLNNIAATEPEKSPDEPEKLLTLSDIDNPSPDSVPEVSAVPTAEQNRNVALEKVQSLMEEGRIALAANDYNKAQQLFSEVLNIPDHAFRQEAERLYLEAKNQEEAKLLEQMPAPTQANPQNTETQIALANPQVLLEQGKAALRNSDYRAAEAVFKRLLGLNNPDFQAEAEKYLRITQEAALIDEVAGKTQISPQEPLPATEQIPPQPDTPEKKSEVNSDSAPVNVAAASTDPAVLMEQGRKAMESNDMGRAAEIFSQVLSLPNHPYMAEAERSLRLARATLAQDRVSDTQGAIIGAPQTLEDVAAMMDQGRIALRDKDNNRAIVIFEKLIALPEHPHIQEARELLGLARQRNGQSDQAKAIYEEYLKLYPKGQDADRVRQRLAEIISAEAKPKTTLGNSKKQSGKEEDTKFRFDNFGSVAQTYIFGVREVVEEEETDSKIPNQPKIRRTVREEDQDVLFTYLSGNSRIRNNRYDIRSAVAGNHQKNFLKDDNKDRLLINQFYVDLRDKQLGYAAKVGRQSGSTAGTLGRFDGALLGYDLTPTLRLNSAFGFPVDLSNKDSIDFDTVFLATNAQFKNVFPNMDIIPFFSYQSIEGGLMDRVAIGEEMRFFHPRGNFSQILDYDVLFGDVNLFLLNAQYNFTELNSVYFNLDYRATPFHSLRNALLNQSGNTARLESVNALLATQSEDVVRDLAVKQTSSMTSIIVGSNYSFTEKIQLSADVTWGSQAYSVGQLELDQELPSSEDAITYSTRLTTIGLLFENEISILSLTYTDAVLSDDLTFLLQNRSPFGQSWRVDSEFRINPRDELSGQNQLRLRPAVKVTYDWRRIFSIETELGAEFINYGGNTTNEDTTRFFGSIGYRVIF